MAAKIPSAKEDPYWDFFIKHAPNDANNLLAETIRMAPDGNIYSVQTEQHSPDITAANIKELARFWGAAATGIVRLEPGYPAEDGEPYPYALVFAIQADYDAHDSPGVGGQLPVLKAAYVSFEMGAYFRELGFRAARIGDEAADRIAAAAGLGALKPKGRLVSKSILPHVCLSDVLVTDLPLATDGAFTWPPTS